MITVTAPGARTLIEDLGRPEYAHLGVPTSGAADQLSHTLANRLVGNPAQAATLEVALHGPTLTFDAPLVLAYAGSDADLLLNGRLVPTHHAFPVTPGDTLTVGTLHNGVFGYLAVAGGFDADPVLGSRSACTLSGLGPTALAAGDRLRVGDTVGLVQRFGFHRPDLTEVRIRMVPGPHADLFGNDGLTKFLTTAWTISPASSRVGVRLEGPALLAPQESLPSLGMVAGAVQVPPNGQPIVLGPDHGTTGGYPVIAVVVAQDLPLFMQHRPGTKVILTLSPETIPESTPATVVSYPDQLAG